LALGDGGTGGGAVGILAVKGKAFFFVKKNQKTFASQGLRSLEDRQYIKVFLLLFLKKRRPFFFFRVGADYTADHNKPAQSANNTEGDEPWSKRS
jgi:hypothetical protein